MSTPAAPLLPSASGPLPRFWRARPGVVLAAILLATHPAGANPRQPAPPPGAVGTTELSKDPFRLESVGLTMYLPAEATAEATRIGGKMTAQILPADRTWLMNIQTPQTSDPTSTIKEAADQTVALLQGAVGILDRNEVNVLETKAQILERVENLQLRGGPAERIYVSLPAVDGTRIVKGYTIFKPSDRQFVVFELITPEPEFARAKGVYETTVATAEFVDPVALAANRGQSVKAGVALLSRLDPKDYEALLDGQERWVRLYVPAPSGSPRDAEEVGYRGMTFWKGYRGEVDPDRPRSRWTAIDRQEGYLVRVRARIIQGNDFLDSEGIYFMTPDRREETWSMQMAVRDAGGKQIGLWREVGVRADSQMTVSVEQTGQPPRRVQPLIEGEGYLSQFEAFLLPRLMIRAGVETEFGFYTYRSESETISLRRDELSRDAGGTWTIRTKFREDVPAQVSVYTEEGELVRTDRGNGQVVTPVQLRQLEELWRSKGLPTGPLQRRR